MNTIERSTPKNSILPKHARVVSKIIVASLILIALILGMSWHFGCVAEAVRIGIISASFGAAFSSFLAGVTRTMNPNRIYLLLLGAAVMLIPVFCGWPAVSIAAISSSSPNPESAFSYLEAVRILVYIAAIPAPFAYIGKHTSDIEAPE